MESNITDEMGMEIALDDKLVWRIWDIVNRQLVIPNEFPTYQYALNHLFRERVGFIYQAKHGAVEIRILPHIEE